MISSCCTRRVSARRSKPAGNTATTYRTCDCPSPSRCLIFNALADALAHDVQADSGMVFQMNTHSRARAGRHYSPIFFSPGGYGALSDRDGRPAPPAPANIVGGSIEFWEEQLGCTFLPKEILRDSGGAEEFQGGNGQVFALRNDTGLPLEISFTASRTRIAARGFAGGRPGARRLIFVDGVATDPKGRVLVADGGGEAVHAREAAATAIPTADRSRASMLISPPA